MKRLLRIPMWYTLVIVLLFALATNSLLQDNTSNNVQAVAETYTAEIIEEVIPSVNYSIPYAVAAPPAEEKTFKVISLTDAQVEMLARIVAAEVGNSSYKCQLGVAQVMYDRLLHRNKNLYHGTTIEDVVLRKGQFAAPTKRSLDLYPLAKQAVRDVFFNGNRAFDAITVVFFHPAKSDPAQVSLLRKYTYVATIDTCEFRSDTFA